MSDPDPIPDDVRSALERFERFLSRFDQDDIIDADSGFSASDALLLMAEAESAAQYRRMEQDHSAQ